MKAEAAGGERYHIQDNNHYEQTSQITLGKNQLTSTIITLIIRSLRPWHCTQKSIHYLPTKIIQPKAQNPKQSNNSYQQSSQIT